MGFVDTALKNNRTTGRGIGGYMTTLDPISGLATYMSAGRGFKRSAKGTYGMFAEDLGLKDKTSGRDQADRDAMSKVFDPLSLFHKRGDAPTEPGPPPAVEDQAVTFARAMAYDSTRKKLAKGQGRQSAFGDMNTGRSPVLG